MGRRTPAHFYLAAPIMLHPAFSASQQRAMQPPPPNPAQRDQRFANAVYSSALSLLAASGMLTTTKA
jgi:hypothetical protein